MTAGRTPELAARAFLHDLIPNDYIEIATSIAAALLDLNSLDGDNADGDAVTGVSLRGKRIWLQAVTEDMSVLRGDHVATMGMGVGISLVTTDNPLRTAFVDGGADNNLTIIAAGTGTLRIYYSSDL